MSDELVGGEPVVEAKGGGRLKKLLLLAVPVLLIGAGAGWWVLSGSKANAATEETPIEERGVVIFDTFLVNLSDPGGGRFLKATLQLVFASEVEAKTVEGNPALMGHTRSAVLELLTEQSAQVLVTAEGKQKLKEGIKARVAPVLKNQKVVDVLFSEFVVQF